MKSVAFYAPMKSPQDPVPSGDRTMARNIISALHGSSLPAVRLASELRSRDGRGDAQIQTCIFEEAEREIERLLAGPRPDLWLTYHSYYKAPDLLGPRLSRHWNIPYAIIEGTRASKRQNGPYARFAAAAEAACDAANVIFYLTEHDRMALERDRTDGQSVTLLRPFLAQEKLPPPVPHARSDMFRLIACAMFRPGDKLESYRVLASALSHVKTSDWSLTIIGDGPARTEVEELFSPFSGKVSLLGALDRAGVATQLREGDLFVWPGVGEAFGMVYLEAQAQGCPVLAEDRPGVRDVVRNGGLLVPANDPLGYAAAIDQLAEDVSMREQLGVLGHQTISADHLLPAARAVLERELEPLLHGHRS